MDSLHRQHPSAHGGPHRRDTRAERCAPVDAEPPAPLARLPQLLAEGVTLLVDVHPLAEFEHWQILRAVSAPVDDLANCLVKLPRDRELIACFRGPHCTHAYEAVGPTRAKGLRARRLDGGFLAWRTCEIEQRVRAAACP